MAIKQISIFVENKSGRLADITKLLADGGISIRSFSIADTTDFGILRLIVDDSEKAENILKSAGVTMSVTEVVGILISDTVGAFAEAIKVLSDSEQSVEYAYAFFAPEGKKAYAIVRVTNNKKAIEVLKSNGITVIEDEKIFLSN